MSQYGAEGRPAPADLPRSRSSTTPAPVGTPRRGITVLHQRDTTATSSCDPVRADRPRHGRQGEARAAGERRRRGGASRSVRTASTPCPTSTAAGTARALSGQGEFPAGGDPITLVTPAGERAYRGRLRIGVTSSGDRVTVNAARHGELPQGRRPARDARLWRPTAVQAQAVARAPTRRTSARTRQSAAYQICDTASCQVYGGYDAEHASPTPPSTPPRGLILTVGGKPAFTQFGSSSGGWTSADGMSYLPAQADPYDGWSGNPVHAVVGQGRRRPDRAGLAGRRRPESDHRHHPRRQRPVEGRVGTIRLVGTEAGKAGSVSITGDTFRYTLGLRSTWFSFA